MDAIIASTEGAVLRMLVHDQIQVSNFNADLLGQLLADSRITTVPAVNQCNHAIGNHNASHESGTGGRCVADGVSDVTLPLRLCAHAVGRLRGQLKCTLDFGRCFAEIAL